MSFLQWFFRLFENDRKDYSVKSGQLTEEALADSADILAKMEGLFLRYNCDLELDLIHQLKTSLIADNKSFLGFISGPIIWGGVGSISDCDLQASGFSPETAMHDQKQLKLLLSKLGKIILGAGVRSKRISSLTEFYEHYACEP